MNSYIFFSAILLFLVGLFMLCRGIVLWYFKINTVIDYLFNISLSLKKLVDILKEQGNKHDVDIKN